MEKKLNLDDISNISSFSESFSYAERDYIFSHFVINREVGPSAASPTVSFEGMILILVVKGSIGVMLNGAQHRLTEGAIAILGPSDVTSVTDEVEEGTEIYTLFMSRNLLNGVNFDVNVINPRFIVDKQQFSVLDSNEIALVRRYLNLLHSCAVNNGDASDRLSLITRSIGRNIVVALLYQLAYINEKRHLITAVDGIDNASVGSRKVQYVHDFMHLLHEYYCEQRTVAFYAGKLCISPKYLSLLVRDVTGRSAAAIIDQYVINEAKNMLRYSGYTIQQVAYKLNFPNQSAFGKYFKHLTGVSPTAFRSC